MSRVLRSAPKRLLLVSLDQVGDLVFASALVPPLRERFPGVPIDLWCREYTRDVAELIPGIDRIVALNPFWVGLRGARRGTVLDLIRAVAAIRATPHDIAILAAAPWRAAAAVALTGTPMRIGHARRKNGLFLTHVVREADRNLPVLAEEARLLSPLGVVHAPLRPSLDAQRVSDRITAIRQIIPGRIAVLHAFASIRERCVRLAEWRTVAQGLDARGFTVVWMGTPAELDEVRRDEPDSHWRYGDQIGGERLRDAAALLAASSLFIGHDSGPLHVANAFGVPSVGVFAPGEPRRTFPQGRGPWQLVARDTPHVIRAIDILNAADTMHDARDPTPDA